MLCSCESHLLRIPKYRARRALYIMMKYTSSVFWGTGCVRCRYRGPEKLWLVHASPNTGTVNPSHVDNT